MQQVLYVGLAGLVGTLFRYGLASLVARHAGERFPFGTLAVNVLGCFLAGLLLFLLEERLNFDPTIHAVVMVGFLGGFTTFSSFGLQTFILLREGQVLFALLNMLASNALGLLTVVAGYGVGKLIS